MFGFAERHTVFFFLLLFLFFWHSMFFYVFDTRALPVYLFFSLFNLFAGLRKKVSPTRGLVPCVDKMRLCWLVRAWRCLSPNLARTGIKQHARRGVWGGRRRAGRRAGWRGLHTIADAGA